jgi:hypothetical protein
MNTTFYQDNTSSVNIENSSTQWKNPKYNLKKKDKSSSTSSNQTPNYSNIQIPVLQILSPSINHDTTMNEPFTDNARKPTWVNPLTKTPVPYFTQDEDMIGLNANETRTDYLINGKLNDLYYKNTQQRNIADRDTVIESTPGATNSNTPPVTSTLPKPSVPPNSGSKPPEVGGKLPEVDTSSPVDEVYKNKTNTNITRRFNHFYADKTVKNAKLLAVAILENIPELFFVPELISVAIVRSSTPKDKRNGPDYAQNKFKLTTHFKSFMVMLICIYITFNWWYLMLYTDHYFDVFNILKSPFLLPLIWIIGPVMAPFAKLNYYLLGKRLEPEFYSKYVEPILRNKPIYLSLLLLIVITLYDNILKLFVTNMKSLIQNKSDTEFLFVIVAMVASITYLYSVVFDEEKNTKFINKVSFALSILFYIIMFIVIMMLCKVISGVILIYLIFYSFLFLLFWEGVNMPNKILEMIVDTTEVCVKNTDSKFGKLQNILYKYSFLIFIFAVLAIRIGHAIIDARTITEERVRVSCYALYTGLGLGLLIFTSISFWRVFQNVYSIIIETNKPAADTTDPSTNSQTPGVPPGSSGSNSDDLPEEDSILPTWYEKMENLWETFYDKTIFGSIIKIFVNIPFFVVVLICYAIVMALAF